VAAVVLAGEKKTVKQPDIAMVSAAVDATII